MLNYSSRRRFLFESLFKNAGVGLAVIGIDGVPIRVNAKLCAMLGYAKKELIKTPFANFTHSEDIEKDRRLFNGLLAGEMDIYEIEKRYVKKDGQIFWGLLTVSIVRSEGDAVTLIGMVQDINTRKQAEAALLESEERLLELNHYKDKLFSLIAHDLKGPITSTSSLLRIIEKNHADFSKEHIVNMVSVLSANSFQTSEMLNNLLHWSQSQFREKRFEPVSLSLYQIALEVSQQLQQPAKLKDNTIEILVPPDLEVCADEQMLHVILRNLLSNAIKFSYTGKSITVKASQEASFIQVSITDEGVGLNESSIAKLLNKNQEGITTYGTKGEKGTGLGINLCLQYIE